MRALKRSPVLWLALGLWLTYLWTSSGGLETSDAVLRYLTARSWIEGHGGVLAAELGWNGGAVLPDGRVYAFFGPLQSVLMVPFLLAARALPAPGMDTGVVETFAICLGLFPLLSAGVIALLYRSLGHLGVAPRVRLLTCLGIGLGSLFWHYARMGQEESLVAFGFALWLLGATRLIAGLRSPALLMAAGALGLFLVEFLRERGRGMAFETALSEAQTMAVTTVILFQIFYLLNCRSLRDSFLKIGLWSNPWVYAGIGVLILLQLGFIYLPFMNSLFGTSPLAPSALLQSLLVALIVLPVISAEKWIRSRRDGRRTPRELST